MLKVILQALVSALRSRETLIAENLALRHQIEVLKRNSTRPELRWRDRALWDVLSMIWSGWRDALYIVQPDTVVRRLLHRADGHVRSDLRVPGSW